jgi:hypothetical protein
VFIGLAGGLTFGAIYMLVRRWLPPGRWGGLTYGALLLIVGATRFDPLRPDNRDFNIVGPGWLSVLVFGAIGLGFGMMLAALVGRYSRSLPLFRSELRVVARYAGLLSIVPVFLVILPIAAGAVVAVIAGRFRLDRPLRTPASLLAGRLAGAALALAAAPGTIMGIADIATRSV